MNPGKQQLAWVEAAIAVAHAAAKAGNPPFGALVCRGDEVLARAGNTVRSDGMSTRHAEINALEAAQRTLGKRRLADCTLVSSSEPCPMCAGAAYWAGVDKVIYGASIPALRREGARGDRQLTIRCEAILAPAGIAVVGPVAESSAMALHEQSL